MSYHEGHYLHSWLSACDRQVGEEFSVQFDNLVLCELGNARYVIQAEYWR